MEKTSLYKITEIGQEIWHDDLYRALITSGGLEEMLEIDGLTGVTSNPTIFDGAVNNYNSYDSDISRLSREDKTASDIYTELTIQDIQMACDVLKPVYESSSGEKGYVSLEVNPHLAYDDATTVSEVERLVSMANRKNIMIKVPGTQPGVEAVRELVSQGFNINVTLLFSVEQYEKVARAYIEGLQKRLKLGKEIQQVRSVASFFLSRIDKIIDPEIDKLLAEEKEDSKKERLKNLRGKASITVAKLTYNRFEEIFSTPEFVELEEAGALIQKPLWASMSTKDPTYSDVKYIEALIFPRTVCTMPMVTVEAFRDHGQVKLAMVDVTSEKEVLSDLRDFGIDIDFYLEKLQKDGVQAFIDSYEHLLETINNKKEALLQSS